MLYGFLAAVYFVTIHFREKAAVYVYVGGFCVLSGYHIKRMVENFGGYEMDLTVVLMQQLIRVTYFAWAVHDMRLPAEQLPESSRGRVLKELPSLLDFLAYNFNFLGMLCPSPDFFDYTEFIAETGNYAHVPLKLQSHLLVALKALVCVVFHVLCSQLLYSPSDMISDQLMAKVPSADRQNFLLRFVLLNISVISFRSRYYVIWLVSQVAIDMAGLSYNKASGEFDKYEAARPWDVEWTHWDAKKRVLVGAGHAGVEHGHAALAQDDILRAQRGEARQVQGCAVHLHPLVVLARLLPFVLPRLLHVPRHQRGPEDLPQKPRPPTRPRKLAAQDPLR